jgi:hypothetical protein
MTRGVRMCLTDVAFLENLAEGSDCQVSGVFGALFGN